MTYVLKTLPKGEIETGFYGPAPKFLQFDDFLFSTQGYCEMLTHLATEPKATTSSIMSYPNEILETAVRTYAAQLFALAENNKKKGKKLEQLVSQARLYEITAEEKEELSKLGTIVLVSLYHDSQNLSPVSKAIIKEYKTDQMISFSKLGCNYTLELETFFKFTAYVINGGFLGWPNNNIPSFAQKTKQEILASEHPIYTQFKTYFKPDLKDLN